jgi:translation initiation factor IF-2
VTILGHVDHGKTTILDRIRESNVQAYETGGITQKISVFTVKPKGVDSRITFIDTPGHEAFDLMRLRGGSIADITLLVVAANDGVQPQTKESIEVIKNSSTHPIVVINKCDLPDIDIKGIKRELANEGIQVEDMGGDIPSVEVSGKTGKGIQELLDIINLVIDVEGLRRRETLSEDVLAQGVVLESVKEKSRGNVSTIIVTQGNFTKGNFIGYFVDNDSYIEKIKALVTEDGESQLEFNAGCGGKIIGLSHLLDLGSQVYVLEENNKDILKNMIDEEKQETSIEEKEGLELSSFFEEDQEDEEDKVKEFPIILKSSSEGSLEALKNSLEKLKVEGANIEIVESGVGNITIRDVERAEIAKAVILGFEVDTEKGVEDLAKKKKVLIKTYDVIYKLLEEMSDALNMLVIPEETEEEIGKGVVKAIFTLSDGTKVLGNRVEEGKLKRGCKVYIVRDDEILVEGKIKSLRINKNDVNEATKGVDCGITLDTEVEAQEGDEIYCYKVVK